MSDLTKPMQTMVDAIRGGGGRVSVSNWPTFHVTTRKGWGSRQKKTWEGLVQRGAVVTTGDWDQTGRWWELVDE